MALSAETCATNDTELPDASYTISLPPLPPVSEAGEKREANEKEMLDDVMAATVVSDEPSFTDGGVGVEDDDVIWMGTGPTAAVVDLKWRGEDSGAVGTVCMRFGLVQVLWSCSWRR